MLFTLPNDLTLTYERSGYRETGRYAEALAFCQTLAKRSKFCQVLRYGTTGEGRPMIALLISKTGKFSPATMGKGGRPLIFVQNGIHAGEIEGKDASLMLARGMLLEGKEPKLFAQADWVILPVYNVDGHERMSKYNRVNQNGPVEMGWRTTAQNYNLNRDYVKADAPETRAWLNLIQRFKPDFFFDDHTTDGADYQYSNMLGIPIGPVLPPATVKFQRGLYEAFTSGQKKLGKYWVSPYFDLDDRTHPEKGIQTEDFTARYSNGYLTAIGRPSMLIETHVLKDYRTRVEATYDMLARTVGYVIDHSAEVKAMNAAADKPIREGDSVVLSAKLTEKTRPYRFHAWVYSPKRYESAGGEIGQWIREPLDLDTTIRDEFVPANVVEAPAGYAIPGAWTEVIDRLQRHGIPIIRTKREVTDRFATARMEGVKFGTQSFEGHFLPTFTTKPVTEERTLPAGSVIVPASRLAMQLLEVDAPDCFLRWGFFNTVFEKKEYYEDYAWAPIADEMLKRDSKLKAEFDEWLTANPGARPAQRLAWLFDRSPYADSHLNAYPVVRLTAAQMKSLR